MKYFCVTCHVWGCELCHCPRDSCMDGMDGPGWMYRHGWGLSSSSAKFHHLHDLHLSTPYSQGGTGQVWLGGFRYCTGLVYCRYKVFCTPTMEPRSLVQLSNPASVSPCPHVTDDKDIITGDKVATDHRAVCSWALTSLSLSLLELSLFLIIT